MDKRKIFELITWGIIIALGASYYSFRTKYEKEFVALKNHNEAALALIECLTIEEKIQGHTLPDVSLLAEDGTAYSIGQLLKDGLINVLVITALEGCNQCRVDELARWGLYNRENPGTVSLIVTHQPVYSDKVPLDIVSKGKSLSGLPLYFDHHGELASDLFLEPSDTPLILFISGNGDVLFSYKGHTAIQERSDQILALIKYINPGRKSL